MFSRLKIIVTFFLILTACSNQREALSGTDFPNTLTFQGRVFHENGQAAANIVVQLIPQNFNPLEHNNQAISTDTSDLLGDFSLVGNHTQAYHLIARDSASEKAGIIVLDTLEKQLKRAQSLTLKPSGKMIVPLAADTKIGDRVSIPGTLFHHIVDSTDRVRGFLTLQRIPVDFNFSIQWRDSTKNEAKELRVYENSTSIIDRIFSQAWTSVNIHEYPPGGGAQIGESFLISGGGNDIWGKEDGFHFVYQSVTGDFTLIALLNKTDGTSNFSKAGLMIRESLAPGSANAALSIVQLEKPYARMHSRSSTSGLTFNTADSLIENPGPMGFSLPIWLKLTRQDSIVSTQVSRDKVKWFRVGTTVLTIANAVKVGLSVSSHDSTKLYTAYYDSVSITQNQPTHAPPLLP